ncbi:protein FAR1-RELATED SEQUENCE 4-like [Elaeis guineensis]|uniref:protein FAR1-RELATED SEQUENCE 4-like n=1 Tax=Elaeis guineensis var. tenera TaxID=51953 RepID=UPI003C6CD8A9
MERPNYPMSEAPSVTFRSINWTAANVPMSSGLHAPYSILERGDEFRKGLYFADKIDLQTAVRRYSVDTHHEFKVVESEPNLWIVKCTKNRFNYIADYRKLLEVKQKAMVLVYENWDKSYDLLPKWLRAVEEFNPGSWVKFINTPTDHPSFAIFDHVFWAFALLIEGFKHCRPVISIDATFLYEKYREKLMIATTVDGNNQIFPLSFTIVDEESTDTWGWLLACQRSLIRSRRDICLISDRHAGLLAAVQNEHLSWQPPYAHHVYYLRHAASNFNTRFKDTRLRDLLKRTSMQIQSRKFDKYMKKIKKMNLEAFQWLSEISIDKWYLAHDGGRRFGIMTTNLSKCFNRVL